MANHSEELFDIAKEMLKLLRIIAEPELAKQDIELRESLKKIVGKSSIKAQAVRLMDGSRSQSDIRQLMKIDQSNLSKLVKALREANLLKSDEKPILNFYIPTNFFDEETK
jgi:DNA-binding transcriptional ArsR family regulator